MLDMPQPGAPAPDFELPSTQGALRLSDLTAAGKVVLAFYQEDNTPLCSSTLTVLKEDYDLVRQLRAEVVAVSADALDDIDKGGTVLHVVPWFQPGNPVQYEEIFAALGFEV